MALTKFKSVALYILAPTLATASISLALLSIADLLTAGGEEDFDAWRPLAVLAFAVFLWLRAKALFLRRRLFSTQDKSSSRSSYRGHGIA